MEKSLFGFRVPGFARGIAGLLALATLGIVTAATTEAHSQGYPQWAQRPSQVVRLRRDPPGFAPWRHDRFRQTRVVYVPVVQAPPAPPPSDEHGILVLDATTLAHGQAVRIRWGGFYYDGVVRATLSDGRVMVHYNGWSDLSDETVARSSLRLPR